MAHPFEINPWKDCQQTATKVAEIFKSLPTYRNAAALQGNTHKHTH